MLSAKVDTSTKWFNEKRHSHVKAGRGSFEDKDSNLDQYRHQTHKSKVTNKYNAKPILLQPFGHQVSGRASILCYDQSTLLKSFVQREVYFYRTMPPELIAMTSEFRGVITVSFAEDAKSGILMAYALPNTMLRPYSRQVKSISEEPKPHSKRCVKDYGKSHVIYPSTEAAHSHIMDDIDEVSELSAGFEANMYIADERSVEQSGLQNPWNQKMLGEAWSKIKEKPINLSHGKTKQFIMLENITSKFKRPCVLDLKLGTRVRENASAEKLARHLTAINVGARVSGMQIYHTDRQEFVYHNKYYGHQLSVEGFCSSLRHFFSRGQIPLKRSKKRGHYLDIDLLDMTLVRHTVIKLRKLKKTIASIKSHRFYSSSVLISYEGGITCGSTSEESINDDTEILESNRKDTRSSKFKQSSAKCKSWHGVDSTHHKSTNRSRPRKRYQSETSSDASSSMVDVRMIDFAHFCFNDDKIHPGPDPGFIFGLENVIKILNQFIDKRKSL